jgi:hypothetical protein
VTGGCRSNSPSVFGPEHPPALTAGDKPRALPWAVAEHISGRRPQILAEFASERDARLYARALRLNRRIIEVTPIAREEPE